MTGSSRIPSTGVLSTGVPAASASSATSGRPSQSEENTTRSARASSAGTSWRTPVSVTRSPRPSAATCASSAPRSGPSPTIMKRASGRAAATSAAAAMKRAWFFCSTSRPTAMTTRRVAEPQLGAAGGRRRDAVRDHPEPGQPGRPQPGREVLRHAAHGVGAAQQHARRAVLGMAHAVERRQHRWAPRATREAGAQHRERGDARVVRVDHGGARAPDRARQARDTGDRAGRRAPAVRQHEPLDRRASELGLERAGRPPHDDLVATPRQLARERDHDALGTADVGAGRGEQDPHRARSPS